MMVGYQPKRISTHAVESDISGGVISDAIAYTYQQGGHEFYVLTFPAQDKTWVYDVATDMWHKRAYRDNLNILHRHLSNCHAVFQGMNLVGDFSNGMIYSLDQNTFTDNGQPILRLRRTPHLTDSFNRVYFDFLQIQFQPGVGLVTGQGSTPQMMLRWTDDGGHTYGPELQASLGRTGETAKRVRWTRLGQTRRNTGMDRVWEISHLENIPTAWIGAEMDAEPT